MTHTQFTRTFRLTGRQPSLVGNESLQLLERRRVGHLEDGASLWVPDPDHLLYELQVLAFSFATDLTGVDLEVLFAFFLLFLGPDYQLDPIRFEVRPVSKNLLRSSYKRKTVTFRSNGVRSFVPATRGSALHWTDWKQCEPPPPATSCASVVV